LLVARFVMDFAKSTDFLYRETETFWAFESSVYQFVATLYMTSADQRQSRYVPASYQNAEIGEGAWKRTQKMYSTVVPQVALSGTTDHRTGAQSRIRVVPATLTLLLVQHDGPENPGGPPACRANLIAMQGHPHTKARIVI